MRGADVVGRTSLRWLGVGSPHASVAVIGGSGFYGFLEDAIEVPVQTPYGEPSAPLAIGTVGGTAVAFLPRHGKGHAYPPHLVNYRANMWALRSVGVRQVLAPCAVGGLLPSVAPGDLVVPDQLVDRTSSRSADLRRAGRRARAVRRPLLRPAQRRRLGGGPVCQARWRDGGDRGAAVLDPGGVAVVRRGRAGAWST